MKEYFDSRGMDLGDGVDWTADERMATKAIIASLDNLPDEQRPRVTADFERVGEMTDEVGQTAILGAVPDRQAIIDVFDGLQNEHERSLWLFLNDGPAFHRAEEVRYSEYYRQTRYWDGFLGPKGLEVSRSDEDITAFQDRLREFFRPRDGSGRTVKIEVFERTALDADGKAVDDLTQVTVYLEGVPSSVIEFEGEDLTRRFQRPAVEVALTYSPPTGAIDVIAKGGRPVRESLARMFLETLLRTDTAPERVTLRRYDLARLARPFTFPTDPDDGIRNVRVTRLRLRPHGDNAGRVTLEANRGHETSLHDMSRSWFDRNDPLTNGFMVQHAKLSIEFHPRTGARRGKILSVEITTPNGCNLKDHTEDERLIGEKYLARWGLVHEV